MAVELRRGDGEVGERGSALRMLAVVAVECSLEHDRLEPVPKGVRRQRRGRRRDVEMLDRQRSGIPERLRDAHRGPDRSLILCIKESADTADHVASLHTANVLHVCGTRCARRCSLSHRGSKERADEYRDHLLAISITGDWAPWVEFFAAAVRDESRSGHDRIMRLLALREEISGAVRSALPRARLALEIADDLIAYPILSVADAQRRYGRSNQANRNAVASLVELGVLEPYGEARYDRLYWSRRVFQAIER